ncbi:hypothetical protein CapIbe_022792 [Capra ibex]
MCEKCQSRIGFCAISHAPTLAPVAKIRAYEGSSSWKNDFVSLSSEFLISKMEDNHWLSLDLPRGPSTQIMVILV